MDSVVQLTLPLIFKSKARAVSVAWSLEIYYFLLKFFFLFFYFSCLSGASDIQVSSLSCQYVCDCVCESMRVHGYDVFWGFYSYLQPGVVKTVGDQT